jgi:hypothetical protein
MPPIMSACGAHSGPNSDIPRIPLSSNSDETEQIKQRCPRDTIHTPLTRQPTLTSWV